MLFLKGWRSLLRKLENEGGGGVFEKGGGEGTRVCGGQGLGGAMFVFGTGEVWMELCAGWARSGWSRDRDTGDVWKEPCSTLG